MTDTLLQDLRYALRLWKRRPGVALVGILTLALGIGVDTAMCSIVLEPVKFPDAPSDSLHSRFGRS